MKYNILFIRFSENYHHLYSLLSQLKIPVLDAQRKEAKQKYNDALAAYVTLYFGRPLEKLNVSHSFYHQIYSLLLHNHKRYVQYTV